MNTFTIGQSCYGDLILFLYDNYKEIKIEPTDNCNSQVDFKVADMGGLSVDKVFCVIDSFIKGTQV